MKNKILFNSYVVFFILVINIQICNPNGYDSYFIRLHSNRSTELLKLTNNYSTRKVEIVIDKSELNSKQTKLKLLLNIAGSINYSSVSFLDNISEATVIKHPGFNMGLGINKTINNHFELSTKINYVYISTELANKKIPNYLVSKQELFHWINIPTCLVYKYPIFGFSLNLSAGLSIDYLIDSKYSYKEQVIKNVYVTKYQTVYQTENSSYNERSKLNMSILSGLGIDFPMINNCIPFLNFQYAFGIININKDIKKRLQKDDLRTLHFNNDFSLNNIFLIVGIKIPLVKDTE